MFEFIWKDVIVIVVRCELMEWIRRKELISKKWLRKEMILLKTFCHLFFVDARKPTLRGNLGKGKGVAGKGQRNEEVT